MDNKESVSYGPKVRYAQLHQGIFIPGSWGELGKNLIANNDPRNKLAGCEMFYGVAGLYVSMKGKTVVVPHANVACAELL